MPSICVFCKLDMKSRLESNSFSQNFGNIWAYLDLRALWRSLNLPKWLNLWHGGWVFWVLGEGLCCQPTSHLFFFFFLSLPIVVQFKRFPTLIIGVIKKKIAIAVGIEVFVFPLICELSACVRRTSWCRWHVALCCEVTACFPFLNVLQDIAVLVHSSVQVNSFMLQMGKCCNLLGTK